jgi:alkylation response protein AidB-like acyl-CoA dehydrogenase
VHASDAIKQTYLPKLTTGEWTGTMNLTEPHCGTDLGLIAHQARRRSARRHLPRSPGTKIFISVRRARPGREHRPSRAGPIEVRAGGGQGHLAVRRARSILPTRRRRAAQRRLLRLHREKMGIHGNSTCVMNYDGAKAWLVGENQRASTPCS